MGSSQIRGRTHVSCIGKWILYHWASREAPHKYIFNNEKKKIVRRWHCFTLLWVLVMSGAETVGSHTCLCIHPTAMHCFGGSTWKKSSLTQIYNRKREEHFSFLYLFIWLLRVLVAACELPDQGANPFPLHWEHRVLALDLQGHLRGGNCE